MTNFIVIVDPKTDRRKRCIESAKTSIAPVAGLAIESCCMGDFAALWARSPHAPVSKAVDNSAAAIIWGEAISDAGSQRQDAAALNSVWTTPDNKPAAYDGFYCAVLYHTSSRLLMTADLLGLYPVYYYYSDDILLISSSPELLQHHPIFQARFNPAGLVGLLLTNGLFDGQTLWQEVRRLSAGYALSWRTGETPTEIEQYAIPFSDRYFSLPFSNVTEPLDSALTDAVTRHVPPRDTYALLLSGGLDSRMVGGYLRDNGNRIVAVTSGLSTDIEMQCASLVARELGFEHHAVNVAADQYPMCADLAVKWEHLAGGFSSIMDWGITARLGKLAPRVVTGYLGDAIAGASHIHWAYSPATKDLSFDSFFTRVNGWGIQPALLRKLLRRDVFGDVVDHTLDRIRVVYESYADYEFQRAWCFDLHHRQRFHVGQSIWQLSFGAWPIQPVIDRAVLQAVGGMPAAAIAERRAQISLFCSRFPRLARLPLDRSTYDYRPIQPRIRQQLAWHFLNRADSYRRQMLPRLIGRPPVERRFVYRIMDFDWEGWRAVRRHADMNREYVLDLFVKEELDKLLPPPDIDVHPEEVLSGAAGLKMLVGLMLFSKEHPR